MPNHTLHTDVVTRINDGGELPDIARAHWRASALFERDLVSQCPRWDTTASRASVCFRVGAGINDWLRSNTKAR